MNTLDITNLIECSDEVGGIQCPEDALLSNVKIEYTDAEIALMRRDNILLGIIWWTLSYVPITAWYAWRRVGIRAMMDENPWYHRAWNVMWMSHYFVFQLPAIIFPLTFLDSQVINHFYILINYWIGTLVGGVDAAVVLVFWIIAAITFTEVDSNNLKLQHVIFEIFGYATLTFGLWFAAFEYIVPGAYEFLQLSVEPEEKRDFRGSMPEGSE